MSRVWVTFYIGPDETSQQTDKRRATLRRSINAVKTKMRRLGEKGGEREKARLQADRARKESQRQAETEDARDARLETDRANKESKREAETKDARTSRLQDRLNTNSG